MRTRTDLIRTTMRAIDTESDRIGTTGNVLVNYARAAVDALMPQIITVNQLLDLPEGSIVVGRHGHGFVRRNSKTAPWESVTGGGYGSSDGDVYEISERLLRHENPLTLVWKP